MRTVRAIEQCDVAVMMIDASELAVTQDAKIASLIHDQGKGVLVAFNKWDLVEKDHKTHLQTWETFCREVPFLTYAPWFTLSAHTRQRSGKVMQMVWDVHQERAKRIDTSTINEFLETVIRSQPPRYHGGGVGKIYFATQAETCPPTIVLSVNNQKYFERNYLRFLNNRFREEFGFVGTRIYIRTKAH